MSYCRWSSLNWTCDLYCYEDVSGGYTTYVANRRIVGKVPEAPLQLLVEGKLKEFEALECAQMKFLEHAEYNNIGLPYDGQSFNDPTLETFLARLLNLKKAGYNVPDYTINEVKKEMTR